MKPIRKSEKHKIQLRLSFCFFFLRGYTWHTIYGDIDTNYFLGLPFLFFSSFIYRSNDSLPSTFIVWTIKHTLTKCQQTAKRTFHSNKEWATRWIKTVETMVNWLCWNIKGNCDKKRNISSLSSLKSGSDTMVSKVPQIAHLKSTQLKTTKFPLKATENAFSFENAELIKIM